jgi:hypothetical protein
MARNFFHSPPCHKYNDNHQQRRTVSSHNRPITLRLRCSELDYTEGRTPRIWTKIKINKNSDAVPHRAGLASDGDKINIDFSAHWADCFGTFTLAITVLVAICISRNSFERFSPHHFSAKIASS